MKVDFLGTGTSTGIPQIGCKCPVCVSDDERDKRTRASIIIETGDKRILIDCGPDFRMQMLNSGYHSLDAILITHGHYDHVGGLDDIRPLGDTRVYAEHDVVKQIKRNMPYCFSDNPYPGVPLIQLIEITEKDFYVDDLKITPIRVMHARLPILGFRIGKMAYLTDVKTIDKTELEKLKNLDLLIINALRIKEHISHLSLQEALEISETIGAKKTYFTHFSHDLGKHDDVEKILPQNTHLSYDRLQIIL
jgi:phosphoribosyl 1,2-cyclic phosphate phosphodiesterase